MIISSKQIIGIIGSVRAQSFMSSLRDYNIGTESLVRTERIGRTGKLAVHFINQLLFDTDEIVNHLTHLHRHNLTKRLGSSYNKHVSANLRTINQIIEELSNETPATFIPTGSISTDDL